MLVCNTQGQHTHFASTNCIDHKIPVLANPDNIALLKWGICSFLQVPADSDDPIKCPKVIVFLPMLMSLFSICRQGGCGNSVDPGNIHLSYKGACLTVTATCDSSHVTKVWLVTEREQILRFYLSVVLFSISGDWKICNSCDQHLDWNICLFDWASRGTGLFYEYFSQYKIIILDCGIL